MNKILISVLFLFMIACQSKSTETSQESSEPSVTIQEETPNFDWLIGQWERVNEEKGKNTYENWEKIKEGHYYGFGFTMRNGDTITQEKMTIIQSNEEWKLTVKVPEDTAAVDFDLSNLNDNEFTFVNKEIDFPNTIHYWKNGDQIQATVANSEFQIDFEFKRLN